MKVTKQTMAADLESKKDAKRAQKKGGPAFKDLLDRDEGRVKTPLNPDQPTDKNTSITTDKLPLEGEPLEESPAEAAELMEPEPDAGLSEAIEEEYVEPETEVEMPDAAVMGLATPEANTQTVAAPEPTTAKHEVVQQLVSTIVSDGYVTEDVKGRKVVMMEVQVPGQGTVRMRLWRKESGVELRIRADNPELAATIRQERGALEAGARERGVNFSRIEVVG